MTRDEFLENFGEFLSMSLDPAATDVFLTDGTWDSLAILSLMGLVSEEWGLTLTAEELAQCRTVGEVTSLFDAYFSG